jgi:aminoglycoside 3-N-acetyltransferase
MPVKRTVGKDRLVKDLRRIGLREGDDCLVHTSMKSIGWLEDGPQTLLDAFLDVLGASGTLLAPAHTLNYNGTPGRTVPPFDGGNRAATGAFPNFLLEHPQALRSGSLTHSMAAIGARAEYYTAGHDLTNPLGFDSPIHRLYRAGGKVLLLGVGHIANTALHLAEELAAGYTHIQAFAYMGRNAHYIKDGVVAEIEQVRYPGCSFGFGRMEGYFAYRGITRYAFIGAAYCQLMDIAPMVDCTADLLRERPDFLLCSEDCAGCMTRKKWLMENPYPTTSSNGSPLPIAGPCHTLDPKQGT